MRFEAIIPQPFFPQAFRVEMEDTMEKLGAGILLDFGKTVNTWRTKPDFDFEFKSNAHFIEAHIFCDAQKQGDTLPTPTMGQRNGPLPAPPNLVYYFLNNGTAIRYAKMSKPFRAKTKVRIIGSFPGVGQPVKVDVRDPQEGIEARKWDEEIAKKYRLILHSQLTSALRRAVIGSGHAMD